MDSWREQFIANNIMNEDNISNFTNMTCEDVIRDLNEQQMENVIQRDDIQEDEEKLISEDNTKGNQDVDISSPASVQTLPLNECCTMSTPSSSPSKQTESPSPPYQIARRKQKQLYSWSVQRKKKNYEQRNESPLRAWQQPSKTDYHNHNRKRSFSRMNGQSLDQGPNKKKQKKIDEYFCDDDLDELISINSQFMNEHFPRIVHNQNIMRQKETESIMMANQQTNALMNDILPTLSNDMEYQGNMNQTMNGENLFDIDLPDFKQLAASDNDNNDQNHNNCKHDHHKLGQSTQAIMDIIEGEVKLANILSEWQSKYQAEDNDSIPILQIGSCNITISKEDLCKLQLFGIGQVNKKWIITRLREYIILIDQHAADERIRVERFTNFIMGNNGPNSYRIMSTKLRNPYEIYIDNQDLETLQRHQQWIRNWGFQYDVMSNDNNIGVGTKIKVYKTPIIYGWTISVDELRELLHNIANMNSNAIQVYIPKCVQRVLASKACRSAIKFGDKLNDKQMSSLLKQLSECKLPFQCAHGRPTLFPIADLNQYDTTFQITHNDNKNVTNKNTAIHQIV